MGSFKRLSLFCLIFALAAGTALAQGGDQKQKLEPEDYGKWQRIFGSGLSPDGEWFYYSVVPVDDDGWLTLKKVGSDSTGEHKFMHGTDPAFSDDNRWFAFRIGVSEEEADRLEEQEQEVRFKLGIMDLNTMEVDTLSNIRDYAFNESGTHMVMRKYPPKGNGGGNPGILVREMESGTVMPYGNVTEYAFNEEGTHLALTIEAPDKLGNGVHLIDLDQNRTRVLDSDTTTYKHLTWAEEEDHLAFMKEIKTEGYEDPTHVIHTFREVTSGDPEHRSYDHREDGGFPDDFRIVDYRPLEWAEHNETVFFGIKPWERSAEAESDTAAADSAKKKKELDEDLPPSNVQVWHWQDDPIQPRQELMANSEKRSNFLSAWHLEENNFVQLADSMVESVSLTGDDRHAIGLDPTPYEPQFEENWNDIYLIDLQTGERELLMQQREFVRSSPGGDYLYWFHAGDWRTYDIDSGEVTNITAGIDARFENFVSVNGRQHPRPWGSGQWAEDDEWLLLYDQYDIWRVSPDGEDSERLTDGAADRIEYRQTRLDYEDDYLSDDETLWLSMYGRYTKDRGYARLDGGDVEQLIYEPMQIGRLSKADDVQRYVYMKEAADDSPDFFATGQDFEEEMQLTNTNPFQENYHWADDELITFVNQRGDTLQGRLLYPADYQPGQTYPMITYIYERRSQTLHSYSTPSRTSPYNQRRYSSEGYFVFEPDINYELSEPGVSAVESVVPAVRKVIETGMINEEQIGLTGHSWGAYQTSFIVTQTDLFNSAVAGAPLTNMVSMYNSIYWNSGTPDAQIFETSQGRFPDPWWMDWENYLENSPIFQAENLDTPLLVEFGTDDGAVDFNQGVELYNTLRRMQKTYVMLVYEGENHGLAREENQIDYATRAFQWHEHFLRGEPAPDWITEGLPWIKRPEVLEEEENGGGR